MTKEAFSISINRCYNRIEIYGMLVLYNISNSNLYCKKDIKI